MDYNSAAKDKHGVQYCMPSQYASNVKSMNKMMGYHNMSDDANASKELHGMQGAKVNKQPMGKPTGY